MRAARTGDLKVSTCHINGKSVFTPEAKCEYIQYITLYIYIYMHIVVENHDKQSSMMVAISFCICTLTLAQALVENSCAHRCTSCCTYIYIYILKPLL